FLTLSSSSAISPFPYTTLFRSVFVMPVTTPRIKVDAVRARGAEVVLHGDSYDEAHAEARRLERRRHLTFVHPYDDPDVIAGQGTDRKSTRLNSSHDQISYAVFC